MLGAAATGTEHSPTKSLALLEHVGEWQELARLLDLAELLVVQFDVRPAIAADRLPGLPILRRELLRVDLAPD